ncbi:MAG: hypothetical protein LBK46_03535 [Oscillospiraceae bacterium]|jgi:hypothetical protein|nr:hypothetical protein [Oscillospiraceae bacterium]
MTFTESNLKFDFSAFETAEQYDSLDNQCAGLKIVDFVAEDSDRQYFIEVKNYANTSVDPLIQTAMDIRRQTDYRMLTDPAAAFPLEMGMKFKDSILRWLAAGGDFYKPIALLLVINPHEAMKPKARLKLIKRISGYIPAGMNIAPERYPRMNTLFFDMPTVKEVGELYGINVTVRALTSPNGGAD